MVTPVLFLNGPCGVGKTTVANAVSQILEDRGIRHVVLDFDALCQVFPRQPDDPHATRVGMAALKAMLPVYGTPCPPLILPRVLETKTALNPFLQVIPNAQPTHVMLQADLPTLDARLGQREAGRSLEHHRARTRELRTILAQAELDALPIDASANSPDSIAADILARTAWPEPPLTP